MKILKAWDMGLAKENNAETRTKISRNLQILTSKEQEWKNESPQVWPESGNPWEVCSRQIEIGFSSSVERSELKKEIWKWSTMNDQWKEKDCMWLFSGRIEREERAMINSREMSNFRYKSELRKHARGKNKQTNQKCSQKY